MNDDKYTEYMLNGDRDFDAILLYTTLGNRYHCALCPQFRANYLRNSAANSEFGLVASAYESQEEKASNNVLFIRVPIDVASGVFQFHEFTTAPIITFLAATDRITKRVFILLLLLPSSTRTTTTNWIIPSVQKALRPTSVPRSTRPYSLLLAQHDSLDRNQALPLASSHHRLPLRFRTSSHRVYLPFPKRTCLFALRELANLPCHLSPRVLNRGIVETRYGMAVTGFAFDLIHGPALMNCGPKGCSLFATGPNQQTMAEGLVTGGLCGNQKEE